MNTRYTEIFLFLSRLSLRSDKGFAMGFVLIVGVLMTATGAVMLLRSASEKEKVFLQKNTFKGIAKVDIGVTRIAHFLNHTEHQQLIKTEWGEWSDKDFIDKIVKDAEKAAAVSGNNNNNSNSGNQLEPLDCKGNPIPWGEEEGGEETADEPNPDTETSSNEFYPNEFDEDEFKAMVKKLDKNNPQWIEIDENDPSAGEFRLTSYKLLPLEEDRPDDNPEPTMVELEVEARGLDQDNDGYLKSNNSLRKVSVRLPILERSEEASEGEEASDSSSSPIPGLWISDTKNGKKGSEDNSKQSSGNQKPIDAVTWIDCTQKSDWKKSGSDYVNNSKLANGKVQQVKNDLPGLPPIPSSPKVRDMGSRVWANCYVTLPLGVNDNNSSCPNVPNVTDEPIGNAYYYKFTGSDSMNLSSVQIRINPPPGKKVIIFASGIISISGTSDFTNYNKYYDEGEDKYKEFPQEYLDALKCRSGSGTETVTAYIGDLTDPSKLEIYSSTSDEALKLQGQNIFSGFLHAPNTKPEFLTESAIAKHRSLTGSGFEQSDRRFPQPTVCCQILS